ncbi:MAG: DUF2852 domain-containing protein, partial [Pseudomonadota bacterium]
MTTTTATPEPEVLHAAGHGQRQGWFRRTEAWLDERGKGAWITAMVLGFVFFWPIGLALVLFLLTLLVLEGAYRALEGSERKAAARSDLRGFLRDG